MQTKNKVTIETSEEVDSSLRGQEHVSGSVSGYQLHLTYSVAIQGGAYRSIDMQLKGNLQVVLVFKPGATFVVVSELADRPYYEFEIPLDYYDTAIQILQKATQQSLEVAYDPATNLIKHFSFHSVL
jgi:hypothetical protein